MKVFNKTKIVKVFTLIIMLIMMLPIITSASSTNSVFIIPVKGEIGPALSEFVIDGIEKAKTSGAHTIVFEIDTLGGTLDDTFKIKDAVNEAINKGIQVITFVNDEAQSAGVMITMLGNKVVMAPGSSMGSAEVRPFDEKINSAWVGELKAVAESRDRDGEVIAAMADKDISIPGLKEKGKLLNITAKKAKELGICDLILNNRQELLNAYSLSDKTIIEIQPNIKTNIASALSGRYIAPALLIIGIVALVIEVFTPSFGILGTIGILSLSTYFAGAILAGRSGWGAVILFIAGIILLAIEAAIPGFGAAGIGGIVSLAIAIVFSAGDIFEGLILLLFVIVSLTITIWLLLKYAPRSGLFKKIVLQTQLKSELGYVSSNVENELLGAEGVSLTILRPSGKADIANRRIDVTTGGEFIQKDRKIKVIKVEGNKVVVKEL